MTVKTLVTGGAGFVGARLVALLRERGEHVVSYDIAPPRHPDDIQGSILDLDALMKAIEGATSVFHLAGDARLWAHRQSRFEQVNLVGSQYALLAARTAKVERFVYCSSLTTLVGAQTPIGPSTADETLRLEPTQMLGAYPKSKLLAEQAVDKASEKIDAVIAMPTEPLGAGDIGLTPPTKMILDFANGKTPAYIDCILNFVPIDSLAQGLVAARDVGARGERYLLGGENIAMSDLLKEIEKRVERPMPETKMPYWVALGVGLIETKLIAPITGVPPTAPLTGVRLAGRQVSFSSEKAFRALGWRAAPFGPALDEALDDLRARELLL